MTTIKKKEITMKTKSFVWNYLTRVDSSQIECNLCHKILKWSGNTTNFWGHLRKHGIDKCSESQEAAETLLVSAKNEEQETFSSEDCNNCNIEIERVEDNIEECVGETEYVEVETPKETIQKVDDKAQAQYLRTGKVVNKPKQSRIRVKDCLVVRQPQKNNLQTNQGLSDDCAIFGSFIVNEMRNLSTNLRKEFKRRVLQALIDTSKSDDGININIPLVDNQNSDINHQLF